MQQFRKMYHPIVSCAKSVYRNEGLGAFYISYPTILSMTVPFTALQFLAYESISTSISRDTNSIPAIPHMHAYSSKKRLAPYFNMYKSCFS